MQPQCQGNEKTWASRILLAQPKSFKRHATTKFLAVRSFAKSILDPKVRALPVLAWQWQIECRVVSHSQGQAFCLFLSFGGSKAKQILALQSMETALASSFLMVCSSKVMLTVPWFSNACSNCWSVITYS